MSTTAFVALQVNTSTLHQAATRYSEWPPGNGQAAPQQAVVEIFAGDVDEHIFAALEGAEVGVAHAQHEDDRGQLVLRGGARPR